MRSLNNYIKESLLDDFDVLDKSSEIAVNKSQMIGNDFEIAGISINGKTLKGIKDTFDLQKIHQVYKNMYYHISDSDISIVYVKNLLEIKNKEVREIVSAICNIVLSADKLKMMDINYIKSLFENITKGDIWYEYLLVDVFKTPSQNICYIDIKSKFSAGKSSMRLKLKKK